MKSFFILMICFYVLLARAQGIQAPHINAYLDFTVALGNHEATATFSCVRNWRLGKARKLELGLGVRWTSYVGSDRDFYTAPARLARSSTVPFIGVFSGHEEQNLDTLTVEHAFTSSLNLSANAGYRIGKKWYVGLNIDLLGFTIGKSSTSVLLSNGALVSEPVTRPSSFNVLLTGDLDYGSLNSEFFVKYSIAPRWDIKAAYQFYFTEYNTQSIHQTSPDGTAVFRFRNKANLVGCGVTYAL